MPLAVLQKLKEYLGYLLGHDFTIEALSRNAMRGLPLYLSQSYVPYRIDLFGRNLILVENIAEEMGTPGRIAKDIVRLRQKFGTDVAMVFRELASWQRQRFVEQGIPFIVPGRQMFLPMFLIDLREYFPKSARLKPRYLGWASQLTLLRQILFADVENENLGVIAKLLGYSPMTITNVRNELAAFEFCEEITRGRSRQLRFFLASQELWSRSNPYLRTPILRQHFVVGSSEDLLLAGVNALALRFSIQADIKPRVAVYTRKYRKLLEQGVVTNTADEDIANAVVEEWRYDPRLLSQDGSVDSLSLFLSLVSDPNERIQIALEEMMEAMTWSRG